MTTINFPDFDPDYLKNWVKEKGWQNLTDLERHLIIKSCKSEMEVAQLMTLPPIKRKRDDYSLTDVDTSTLDGKKMFLWQAQQLSLKLDMDPDEPAHPPYF